MSDGRGGGSHGDNDLGMNESVLIVGCDAASWPRLLMSKVQGKGAREMQLLTEKG